MIQILKWLLGSLLLIAVLVVAGWFGLSAWYGRDLPNTQVELTLGQPLRIQTRDGKLMGEFGAERRQPLAYNQLPDDLIKAFLAAEDDRFFEHPGFDWMGLARAAGKLVLKGEARQGGSTITMQLVRNLYLTPEKKLSRKIREILLAQKLEKEMTKQQILELYLNRIFLGNRAYGVAAAALTYFGKEVSQLTLSEKAVLAGLPKAPSTYNPLISPSRAKQRRDYVLRRMRELGYISEGDYTQALSERIEAKEYRVRTDIEADYVAEMVREKLYAQYGEAIYTDGLIVTTTLDSQAQIAANHALREGLLNYEERHGLNKPEGNISLPATIDSQETEHHSETEINAEAEAALSAFPTLPELTAAAVLGKDNNELSVYAQGKGVIVLKAKDWQWASNGVKKLVRGDVIRLRLRKDGSPRLGNVPLVQGALIALNPQNGAMVSLVGGYDFHQGRYNRVTQAKRQAGSSFKPFLYAAGIEAGKTPATVYLDAPIVHQNADGSEWRPENYNNRFSGPMRLREALVQSRNTVSIRLLEDIGMSKALDFAYRLGLPKERLPRDLTLALGSASLTPLEVARGYAILANGGYAIEPYFIENIRNSKGETLFSAKPKKVGDAGFVPITDPQTLWLITDMMHDVMVRGTAAASQSLDRPDLAGKTGTSNDENDTWFCGFTYGGKLSATVWVGFDQPASLGRGETGGGTALPIWMNYLRTQLPAFPPEELIKPEGLVSVRVNRYSGGLAYEGDPNAVYETVQSDRIPARVHSAPNAEAEESPEAELY